MMDLTYAGRLTRYLNKSFRIGLRQREARALALQCFDGPGYGPLGLARILNVAADLQQQH